MGFLDMFKIKTPAQVKADNRAQLQATAMDNARKARAALGDETIQMIAEKIKNQSAGKRAHTEIKAMNKDIVADHIKLMMKDK